MDSNHRFTDFKSVDSSAGLHAHLNYLLLFYLTTSYSLVKQVFQKMVGMEGLEPPRIAPTDFESVVFAIPPHPHY